MSAEFEDRVYIKRHYSTDVDKHLVDIHGAKYINYRKEWVETEKRYGYVSKYPLDFFVELTSYCNLSCKMCINRFINPERIPFNLPMDIFDELIRQCKEMHVPAIQLGLNAECILHPEIKIILRKCKETFIDIWLYTNGVKLTEDLAEYLIDLKIERLLISLDAATNETYKQIRGINLNVVERNIYRLLDLKKEKESFLPILRLSFVKQEINLSEIKTFLEKWKNHADIIDFQDYIDCSNINNPLPIEGEPFVCSHPFQKIGMDWNGDIYPCCGFYLKYHKLGNIKDMTLLEAWNSQKMKDLRESFFNGKIHVACKNCHGNLKYRQT